MRTSPSGPIALTDESVALIGYTPADITPGVNYVLSFFNAPFVPESDPTISQIPLSTGQKTRAGKIGRVRMSLLAPSGSAGNGNLHFQWTVNGVARGNLVDFTWDPSAFADIDVLTFQQTIDLIRSQALDLDFGVVSWEKGDVVILKATIDAPVIGVNASYFCTTIENTYDR